VSAIYRCQKFPFRNIFVGGGLVGVWPNNTVAVGEARVHRSALPSALRRRTYDRNRWMKFGVFWKGS